MQQVPSPLEFHCSTKGNSFENKSFFLVPFFMVLTDVMMINTFYDNYIVNGGRLYKRRENLFGRNTVHMQGITLNNRRQYKLENY